MTSTERLDEYSRTLKLIEGIKAKGVPIHETWFESTYDNPPRLSYVDLYAKDLEALAAACGVTA